MVGKLTNVTDHGRLEEPGYEANWKKIARFEKLENFSSVFQNGLAFLGRIGKASLSEFPEIYANVILQGNRKSVFDACFLSLFHQSSPERNVVLKVSKEYAEKEEMVNKREGKKRGG